MNQQLKRDEQNVEAWISRLDTSFGVRVWVF